MPGRACFVLYGGDAKPCFVIADPPESKGRKDGKMQEEKKEKEIRPSLSLETGRFAKAKTPDQNDKI